MCGHGVLVEVERGWLKTSTLLWKSALGMGKDSSYIYMKEAFKHATRVRELGLWDQLCHKLTRASYFLM